MSKIHFIIILIIVASCNSNQNVNIFEPQTKEGNITYKIDDFRLAEPPQLVKDVNFWTSMNHSEIEVGVFKTDNGVKFKKPRIDNPYYFDLVDGKLEVTNHGEFGGEFIFIPTDNAKDTVRIIDANVIYIFRFNNEIYFLTGIAHMSDRGGAISKLTREGNKFDYESVLELDSAPEAMTIYQDKILIAGNQNFTVVHGFKKEFTIDNTLWTSLYPNSIVALNDEEVYIGMRGGYAKVSLSSKKIKYYKHKSVKEGV
jgi:hypothetical protein